MGSINVSLNGRAVTLTFDDSTEPLLYLLRNQAGQHGPKFGCGVSQCGACTVLVDGAPMRSCTLPVSGVRAGAAVMTLDGLGTPDRPHPIQQAFIDEQAAQCGFCMNGMVMGALGWLQARIAAGNKAVPSEREIATFLDGTGNTPALPYVCRCGAHPRVIAAVRRAAQVMVG